ncbi:MAG: translesion error-prone DNA polymerase V autoproteolytic subunit [Candidatus Thiothrix singaporensis]|uniref:Translesion error-prone DNA polymerase V autoproteolytic subunit n=1 Tax=Candidatus Thiothrix singaporensis TaxID=2799669 RepID=A0A7L6AZ83_9GAMM|nr:MAG: translesion error-prone DNA polymerase V autoproteolytic subunit [Candidatus Thiothrix singaporensis]
MPVSRIHDVKRYLQQTKVARDLGQHPDIRFPANDAPEVLLPLFASKVAAGFASPADDYIETSLDLNQYLIKHPAATFFLRVEGNSMLGAGIHDGDTLVVDRSLEARSGKVVIAAVNGELTVKRLHIGQQQRVTLLAENPDYPNIPIRDGMDFVIWGVVTNVIHPV